MNLPALGHPNYQIPFFLFVYEKEGNAFGVLSQKHGDHHQPIGYYSQQLDAVGHRDTPCLRAITVTAPLVKAIDKITVESPLTIFVPHAVEALLNSHHTRHFSASHLTSYEVLWLTVLHSFILE